MEEGEGGWGGSCYGVGEDDDKRCKGRIEKDPIMLVVAFEIMTGSVLTS